MHSGWDSFIYYTLMINLSLNHVALFSDEPPLPPRPVPQEAPQLKRDKSCGSLCTKEALRVHWELHTSCLVHWVWISFLLTWERGFFSVKRLSVGRDFVCILLVFIMFVQWTCLFKLFNLHSGKSLIFYWMFMTWWQKGNYMLQFITDSEAQ